MLNRTTLLGGVCALALSAIPFTSAMAGAPMGFAGTLGASYGQSSCSGCGTQDNWNVNGAGAFGFTPMFGGEIDAGYNNVSGSGFSSDVWGVGGSLFWAPAFGRVGGTVAYATTNSGGNAHIVTFGGFGEFYASNFFTVGLKGGGFSFDTSGFSDTGGYVGGAVTGYAMPDLAITGSIDYATISGLDLTNFGIGAGYNRTHASFTGSSIDVDTWMVALKFYFGGGMTLVERQREGTLGWAGNANLNSIFQF
jgi:hypothetical protein